MCNRPAERNRPAARVRSGPAVTEVENHAPGLVGLVFEAGADPAFEPRRPTAGFVNAFVGSSVFRADRGPAFPDRRTAHHGLHARLPDVGERTLWSPALAVVHVDEIG